MHPTFANVRAGGFLANSVQAQVSDQSLDIRCLLLGSGSNQPWPKRLARRNLTLEHTTKGGCKAALHSFHLYWPAEEDTHGRDTSIGQATGHDERKVRHIWVHV